MLPLDGIPAKRDADPPRRHSERQHGRDHHECDEAQARIGSIRPNESLVLARTAAIERVVAAMPNTLGLTVHRDVLIIRRCSEGLGSNT